MAVQKNNQNQVQSNLPVLIRMLESEGVQQQFRNALNEYASVFKASIVELVSSNKLLQLCNPQKLITEVLKAATLKLPLNKELGMAYILPYKNKKTGEYVPQFQLGYRGYIQLAIRTGQYKFINAGPVYEGQLQGQNPLTGEIDLSGEPISDKIIGFFAYFELINGFRKSVYWSKEKMDKHAERYSPSLRFNREESLWTTNYEEMALKTIIKHLLANYGILSIDMMTVLASDSVPIEDEVAQEIELEANKGEVLDINTAKLPSENHPNSSQQKVQELKQPPQLSQPTQQNQQSQPSLKNQAAYSQQQSQAHQQSEPKIQQPQPSAENVTIDTDFSFEENPFNFEELGGF